VGTEVNRPFILCGLYRRRACRGGYTAGSFLPGRITNPAPGNLEPAIRGRFRGAFALYFIITAWLRLTSVYKQVREAAAGAGGI
jgi:hypothetical protein